jgi:hypothetical protein
MATCQLGWRLSPSSEQALLRHVPTTTFEMGMMKALSVTLLALSLWLTGCASSHDAQMTETDISGTRMIGTDLSEKHMTERQAEVALRGAEVMPFNLDATTHIFEKTPKGGVQQVVADSNDPEQVRLIREHLKDISTKFAKGNFHEPGMIHGPEMAGLHELMMGHERLAMTYREIDLGGEIQFSSEDAKLVSALQAWFDQQVSDHGEHAQDHQ